MNHRRPGDVAGGKQSELEAGNVPGLEIFARHHSLRADAIANLQQVCGDRAAEDLLMAGDVVGMGVGDKGKGLRAMRVQPQAYIGQMQVACVFDPDFSI